MGTSLEERARQRFREELDRMSPDTKTNYEAAMIHAFEAVFSELEALRGDNEALTQALADERARTIAETQRADAAERKLAEGSDKARDAVEALPRSTYDCGTEWVRLEQVREILRGKGSNND